MGQIIDEHLPIFRVLGIDIWATNTYAYALYLRSWPMSILVNPLKEETGWYIHKKSKDRQGSVSIAIHWSNTGQDVYLTYGYKTFVNSIYLSPPSAFFSILPHYKPLLENSLQYSYSIQSWTIVPDGGTWYEEAITYGSRSPDCVSKFRHIRGHSPEYVSVGEDIFAGARGPMIFIFKN